jgi:hypothetical protein
MFIQLLNGMGEMKQQGMEDHDGVRSNAGYFYVCLRGLWDTRLSSIHSSRHPAKIAPRALETEHRGCLP